MLNKLRKLFSPHYAALIAATIIWGFVVIPVQQLGAYPLYDVLLSRIFTSFILLTIYVLIFNRQQLKIDYQTYRSKKGGKKKKVMLYIFASGLLLALNWGTYITIIALVDVKSSSIVYIISPLFVALGGFIIYKDKIDIYKKIALGMATVVIAYMSLSHLTAILAIILCAAAYAGFILIQKKLTLFNRINLFTVQISLIGILVLPYMIYKAYNHTLIVENYFLIRILIIAICFTIIPMLLNLFALSKLPASTVAILMYINPIVTFLVGLTLFSEHLRIQETITYSILFLCIIIFNWNVLKKLVR